MSDTFVFYKHIRSVETYQNINISYLNIDYHLSSILDEYFSYILLIYLDVFFNYMC